MTLTATVPSAPEAAIRAQWDAAAEGWDAQTPAIRSWLREATDVMFAMAGVERGQTVLDVAAGAGDQTLDLAERVGAEGRVIATDLSAELIVRLQANAQRAGAQTIEARVADAQVPMPEVAAFDAAVCRLGLMLMPDPARALAATVAALKPGARVGAMVFAGPEENPCLRILMGTALRHAGLPPRDPFAPGSLMSLGRSGALEDLFRGAGLKEIVVTRLEAPFRLPSVRDYVAFARAAAAPVRAVLERLEPAAREAAWADIESELSRFSGPDGWEGPNTLLLAAGQR
jgi:SAM-dependent methyltransferase